MIQNSLFEGSSLDRRFAEYHAKNPHVYELFKEYAFRVLKSGKRRYSARAIFHRIRWHFEIETQDEDGFKVNDKFSSRYARLFEREFPQHEGFFEKRILRS